MPQYETVTPRTAAELASSALLLLQQRDLSGCETLLAALITELAGR